jgi:hypothetical protein
MEILSSSFSLGAIKPMLYKIIADMVITIHFLWILFLLFGAAWGIKNRKAKIIHIAGLTFALTIQVFDWYCPLTYLETWLRSKYSPASSYSGPFIIHYIETIVYIELPRSLVLISSILLCVINAWLYLRKKRTS